MIPRLTALLLVALIAVALLKPTSPKTGEKWAPGVAQHVWTHKRPWTECVIESRNGKGHKLHPSRVTWEDPLQPSHCAIHQRLELLHWHCS